VAVVQLLNKLNEMPFNRQDEQAFKEFAESLGVILESCNSFYVAARNQKGVAALLKAISSLEQSLDLSKNPAVGDGRSSGFDAGRSQHPLADRRSQWRTVVEGQVRRWQIPGGVAHSQHDGHCWPCSLHRRNPEHSDAYQDPRFNPDADKRTGYTTRNILCMPVFDSSGKLIAVTQLINKAQGTFTSSDEEFMRAFNIQAGVALENAKLFENVLSRKAIPERHSAKPLRCRCFHRYGRAHRHH
jgi:adenylate cyclase